MQEAHPLPRRPLVGLALAFVAGTGCGLVWPLSRNLLLAILAALLCLIVTITRLWPARTGLFSLVVLLMVLLLGWSNASPCAGEKQAGIAQAVTLPHGVALRGHVTDEPVCVAERNGKCTWKFPLEVDGLNDYSGAGWQAVQDTIRVRLYAMPADRIPAYGEAWILPGYAGLAARKAGNTALGSKVVFFSGNAGKARFLRACEGSPLIAWCLQRRSEASAILGQGLQESPEHSCILSSLLLGYYSQIPRELYQAFVKTGTLHVFAISGSHVAIVALVIVFLLGSLGVARPYWVVLLGPLLVLYTAMTGLQPSAMRACVMGILYWLAPLLGRKPDLFSTLAASLILLLAVNPDDLVNVGFLLSYAAVIGLVLLSPLIARPLKRCLGRDPMKLEADPWWVEAGRSLGRGVADLIAVSIAAWFSTAPLTALFFGNLSLIGVVANLFIVPLSSLVIVTGVVSLLAGSLWLGLADLFNNANLALIMVMTGFTRWLAGIPGGCLQVAPPPLWAVILYYVLLLTARIAWWIYRGSENRSVQREAE